MTNLLLHLGIVLEETHDSTLVERWDGMCVAIVGWTDDCDDDDDGTDVFVLWFCYGHRIVEGDGLVGV